MNYSEMTDDERAAACADAFKPLADLAEIVIAEMNSRYFWRCNGEWREVDGAGYDSLIKLEGAIVARVEQA